MPDNIPWILKIDQIALWQQENGHSHTSTLSRQSRYRQTVKTDCNKAHSNEQHSQWVIGHKIINVSHVSHSLQVLLKDVVWKLQ